MSNPMINFAYFEDNEENKTFFKSSKDAILDSKYPGYCLTNNAGYKYARVLFCTYVTDATSNVHIHESFIVNLFNTSKAKIALNSSIQITLDTVSENGRVISGATNVTCESLKANLLGVSDTDHKVIATEEKYTDGTGATKYGIGIWVKIDGYSSIAIEPVISMSANYAPIHKSHFNAYYVADYISDGSKVIDTNLKNIESEIVKNQIGIGVYPADYSKLKLENFATELNKIPAEYTQNTVFYSNTYKPVSNGLEEVIEPFSIRGNFTTKIVSLDTVNKSFSVSKSGYYALQLRNGFYSTKGSTQLTLNVYKNNDKIKELSLNSYLIENQKNSIVSNTTILELNTTDKITLKLIWGNKNVSIDHDTFITIHPIKFD